LKRTWKNGSNKTMVHLSTYAHPLYFTRDLNQIRKKRSARLEIVLTQLSNKKLKSCRSSDIVVGWRVNRSEIQKGNVALPFGLRLNC